MKHLLKYGSAKILLSAIIIIDYYWTIRNKDVETKSKLKKLILKIYPYDPGRKYSEFSLFRASFSPKVAGIVGVHCINNSFTTKMQFIIILTGFKFPLRFLAAMIISIVILYQVCQSIIFITGYKCSRFLFFLMYM